MVVIEPFLKEGEIVAKIRQLAIDILNHYKKMHFVVVLEGAKTFARALEKEIVSIKQVDITTSYIKLKSYAGSESKGRVDVVEDIDDISKLDVIIVEDIVDTGHTMHFLKKYLPEKKNARGVKICALLDKPSRRKVDVKIDYLGFTVPDLFLVGYGLDYNGKYRELKYVGIFNENKQ